MKVIFLDHDGVICLQDQWGSRFKRQKSYLLDNPEVSEIEMPVECRFDDFDKKAIDVLNSIIVETSCEIVLSTDWRFYCTLDEMRAFYLERGIVKAPIGYTPALRDFDPETASIFAWKGWRSRERVLEIQEYLRREPGVEKWVAVDDLPLGTDGLENFVFTPRSREGIKQSGVKEKIIDILQ